MKVAFPSPNASSTPNITPFGSTTIYSTYPQDENYTLHEEPRSPPASCAYQVQVGLAATVALNLA